jgi:hypothetical protein
VEPTQAQIDDGVKIQGQGARPSAKLGLAVLSFVETLRPIREVVDFMLDN